MRGPHIDSDQALRDSNGPPCLARRLAAQSFQLLPVARVDLSLRLEGRLSSPSNPPWQGLATHQRPNCPGPKSMDFFQLSTQ